MAPPISNLLVPGFYKVFTVDVHPIQNLGMQYFGAVLGFDRFADR